MVTRRGVKQPPSTQKPVLEEVSYVKKAFFFLEDTVTVLKQNLYHVKVMIGQIVQIIPGSNVPLQSYYGVHSKPRYGYRTITEPLLPYVSHLATLSLYYMLCSRLLDENSDRSGKQRGTSLI